jgi:dihydrofolate reductase
MFRTSGGSTRVLDEIFDAGAIIVGRRMLELSGAWGRRSPIRDVPVFVVTPKPPTKDVGSPFAFITEGIGRAVERAVEAAGGQDGLGRRRRHHRTTGSQCRPRR